MAKYTKQQIDKMASAEYAAHMQEPEFQEVVNGIKQLDYHLHAPEEGAVKPPERAQEPAQFDPSWDESPTASAPAPAKAKAPAADAELPELVHEYQPCLNGKPVGGKQVFKYRTQDELIQKLTDAHKNATLELRRRKKDSALEELTTANIERKIKPPAEPRVLTPAEQLELQHKCEKLRASGEHAAAAKLELNAVLGIDVTDLAAQLRESQQEAYVSAVKGALAEFRASNPDYVQRWQCDENAQTLILYIQRRGLDETSAASYQEAFTAMREHLVEVAAPVSVPVPTPAPQVEPAPVRRTVALATGLTNADASDIGVSPVLQQTGKFAGLTLEKINKMSGDEYKRYVRDPAFSEYYDGLQAAAAARRGRR
jgi:hypothetical protein